MLSKLKKYTIIELDLNNNNGQYFAFLGYWY